MEYFLTPARRLPPGALSASACGSTVIFVVGTEPLKGCRVMANQNGAHLLCDRYLLGIVFA